MFTAGKVNETSGTGCDSSKPSGTITMATYYEILGCDKSASYEELKKCYHELVKKCHPDKSTTEVQHNYFLLDKAWRTLRDPESRKEYDLTIGKYDLDEMPVYCEVTLNEMTYERETDSYCYSCRCGGVYVLDKSYVDECERLKISCDECTFHIVVKLDK